MRYLGQLGVAAQVAAQAASDSPATTRRPDADLSEAPALSEERAAAWRDWASAGAREGRPRHAPTREARPRNARPRRFQPASDPDHVTTSARALSRNGGPERDQCDGQARPDQSAIRDLVPARRRFIEWIAQVVADADPDETVVSPRSKADAARSVDEEPAVSDSGARPSGAGRLSALLTG